MSRLAGIDVSKNSLHVSIIDDISKPSALKLAKPDFSNNSNGILSLIELLQRYEVKAVLM
jgi:transposase